LRQCGELLQIFQTDVAINTIVYVELIQGSKSKEEVLEIERYLSQFENIPLGSAISLKAVELVRQYSGSHGLRLAGSFIAATSLIKNNPLLTYNSSDFVFIKELEFYQLA